jgi:hypothetical protein
MLVHQGARLLGRCSAGLSDYPYPVYLNQQQCNPLVGLAILTEEASSNTFLTSAPKHPRVASPFHLQSDSPRSSIVRPKHLASPCANLVSCMSYLRRESSSGKRSNKTAAAVPCGSDEYLRRNSVIHLLRIRRVGWEWVERFCVVCGGTWDISRSKDIKLV